ncbi:MAG TPA: hypothetical protein VK395_29365 [Gemmataceae bacterium]|nr:hypothetical protein [Gemmataceae bacterium]
MLSKAPALTPLANNDDCYGAHSLRRGNRDAGKPKMILLAHV